MEETASMEARRDLVDRHMHLVYARPPVARGVAYLALIEAAEQWPGNGEFAAYANAWMSYRRQDSIYEDEGRKRRKFSDGSEAYVRRVHTNVSRHTFARWGVCHELLKAESSSLDLSHPDLTETQRDVAWLSARGMDTYQIEAALGIPKHTVLYSKRQIAAKLGLRKPRGATVFSRPTRRRRTPVVRTQKRAPIALKGGLDP